MAEARGYAEQTLAIAETLDASVPVWLPLGILAEIAEMEGRTEVARTSRRREREAFAAFAGNRYHLDRQHGQLIAAIVAAARGDQQAREAVEARLPQYEANGWHIEAATRRIWAGEREWHALVDGLDRQDALWVLRVLETLAQEDECAE